MRTRTVLLAAWMLAAAVPLARAATDDAQRLLKQDIDRREQERRDQRWNDAHTPGATPTLPATPPAPAEPAAQGPCFPVRRIMLHPTNILAPRQAHAILQAYQGRCLDAADLAALQHRLNGLALAQGLVTTRVVVPEQNLGQGELKLEVWPGKLERLETANLAPRELRFASPARAGDLLQLRALEQTVDNLNRLPSLHASVELRPGEQPGGSIATIGVQRSRPWQAGLSWQGDALNGEETDSLRASLTADSPLRLADRLTLGLNANLQDGQVDDAHGGSIDYDVPWGWWRFSLGADRFVYENIVHAGLTPFTASGISRSWRVEAMRSLHRDASNRLSLALHGRQRLNDNFIDDVTVGVSTTRIRAVGLRLDFSRVAAPWVWDSSLDIEDGQGRSPALVSPVDRHFTRLQGNSRLQYFLGATSFSAAVNSQWSDARLAPSEQFALTGQVPGFSPLALNAANGVALQLEAARPFSTQLAGIHSLRPSAGLSWALAPHAGGNLQREEIAALTAGLTVPWQPALLHMGLAYPLPQLNSMKAPDNWQLAASFSLQW